MRRSILNVSLPLELKKEMDRAIESGRYATRSEFIRALWRSWNDSWGAYEQKLERGSKRISQNAIREATQWAKDH